MIRGQVIVQLLHSLEDERASPAQLGGVIQRGDVLLAIGRLSIINLPVDQLMEGLHPLSTPDPQGCYQRILHLRFETGVGQGLLKIHEEEHAKSRNNSALSDQKSSEVTMKSNWADSSSNQKSGEVAMKSVGLDTSIDTCNTAIDASFLGTSHSSENEDNC